MIQVIIHLTILTHARDNSEHLLTLRQTSCFYCEFWATHLTSDRHRGNVAQYNILNLPGKTKQTTTTLA